MARREHLNRSIPADEKIEEGHQFSLKEDREAHHIAESEKKKHPNYSFKKRLSIGYATIRNNRKRHRR